MFEERGYLDTRVSDITTAAQLSLGAFYKYFSSKESVFRAVIDELMTELYDAGTPLPLDTDTPIARIEASTRHYMATYRKNASLIAIMEQVSTFNSDFARMRLDVRDKFVSRVQRGIKRLQSQGIADPSLDSAAAARAIASMVGHFAYTWLALGEECDEETAISTLTTLWARGVGLKV